MNTFAPGETRTVEQIQTLIRQAGPFLSLSQATRQTGIPLQTLSSAVHAGRLVALTMPDGRKYVHLDAVLRVFGKTTDSSTAWQAKLLAANLLTEMKPRATRRPAQPDFEPAPIQGEPIAETVGRERR
jgi:hypothetical protein